MNNSEILWTDSHANANANTLIHVWVDFSIILTIFTENLTKAREKQKMNNENELNTDDVDVAKLFNEKFVSSSQTVAAPIWNNPFTTDGIESNEKSFFYQVDCTEHSMLTAEIL